MDLSMSDAKIEEPEQAPQPKGPRVRVRAPRYKAEDVARALPDLFEPPHLEAEEKEEKKTSKGKGKMKHHEAEEAKEEPAEKAGEGVVAKPKKMRKGKNRSKDDSESQKKEESKENIHLKLDDVSKDELFRVIDEKNQRIDVLQGRVASYDDRLMAYDEMLKNECENSAKEICELEAEAEKWYQRGWSHSLMLHGTLTFLAGLCLSYL